MNEISPRRRSAFQAAEIAAELLEKEREILGTVEGLSKTQNQADNCNWDASEARPDGTR